MFSRHPWPLSGLVAALLLASGTALGDTTLMRDAESGCATSNPFPREGESIRWRGGCRNGLLHGVGTLTWFQNGIEYERDSGVFRDGEMDGEAVVEFANGVRISGRYRRGVRDGSFTIERPGKPLRRAIYRLGRLISERDLSQDEAAEWRRARQRERGERIRANRPPPPPRDPIAAAAPMPAAKPGQPAAPRGETKPIVATSRPPPPQSTVPRIVQRPRPPAPAGAPAVRPAAPPVRTATAPPPPRLRLPPAPAGSALRIAPGPPVLRRPAPPPASGPIPRSPRPAAATTVAGALANVCSRGDLFAGGQGWCGQVLDSDGRFATVAIHRVAIAERGRGLGPNPCTGGQTLAASLAQGTRIRVPLGCLGALH